MGADRTIFFMIQRNKKNTTPPKHSAKSLRKSLSSFFFFLADSSFFFIYRRKFGLTCRVQIALTHFAPLLFHLVSLCFNLWKHLFWDGLALGDSFGPGIAHITAILNLTKPDCSKRTFGLGEIGYSSSSISLRTGLDGGEGNYSCSTVKLAKSDTPLNKTTQLNGIITAISRDDKASWMTDLMPWRTSSPAASDSVFLHILWPGWLGVLDIIAIPLLSSGGPTLLPPMGEDQLSSAAFLNREIVC